MNVTLSFLFLILFIYLSVIYQLSLIDKMFKQQKANIVCAIDTRCYIYRENVMNESMGVEC